MALKKYLSLEKLTEYDVLIKEKIDKGSTPTVSTSDDGKFLRVVNGVWTAVIVPNAEEASF